MRNATNLVWVNVWRCGLSSDNFLPVHANRLYEFSEPVISARRLARMQKCRSDVDMVGCLISEIPLCPRNEISSYVAQILLSTHGPRSTFAVGELFAKTTSLGFSDRDRIITHTHTLTRPTA